MLLRAEQSRAEQSRAEQSRATYIDIAKAIGIICVLIGHSFTADCMGILIYAFHMPLFFSCKRFFIKEEEKSGRLDEEKDGNSFSTIFCVLRWNSGCKHIF